MPTTDATKKGAVVVKRTVEAMDAISKSSQQIGRIIGADPWKSPFKLLALNAGVEAARREKPAGALPWSPPLRALAAPSAQLPRRSRAEVSHFGGGSLFSHRWRRLRDRRRHHFAGVRDQSGGSPRPPQAAQEQATGCSKSITRSIRCTQTTRENTDDVACQSLSQEAL